MADIFRIIVDGPAIALGTLLGQLVRLVFMALAIGAGFAVGREIVRRCRPSFIAWPIALVIGIWITAVIDRSQVWFASQIQQSYHDSDDY